MRFFKIEFTASIKKMERWPRDTQKVIFLFFGGGLNYAKSKYMGLSFKSHFKGCRVARRYHVGSVVTSSEMFWFEYGQIIFFPLFLITFMIF